MKLVKLNPHISVDCVVFGFDNEKLKVLLIDRNHVEQVTSKRFKLPGGLVYDHEDLPQAANRILFELTGLKDLFLQQFEVFGSPNRISSKQSDLEWLQVTSKLPINRVVTIGYYALINISENKTLNKNLKSQALWYDIYNLPSLAFDHKDIVLKSLMRIRKEINHEPLVFELLSTKFTIRQLQTIYEHIYAQTLDNRNFRKSLNRLNYIVQLNEKEKDVAHKPALLYKFDKKAYFKSKEAIYNFE